MDNTEPTLIYQCYVGLDIAARDFTAATLFPGPSQKPKLFKNPFPQSPAGFEHFITALKQKGLPPQHQLVVMEATGPYWIALALAVHQAGLAVSVVNPAQVHFFAMAQLKRAKNDKLDAQTLAQFALALTPKLWTPPPQFYHELRQRINQREQLVKLQTQLGNQLHSLLVQPVVVHSVRTQLEELLQTLQGQIKQVDQELEELLKMEQDPALEEKPGEANKPVNPVSEEAWKRNIALLRSIPGIGPLTACWLVLITLNLTTCQSPEALVHYAGLAPMERSSGSSIRGKAQIGHGGNGRLRTLLYLCVLSANRCNPVIAQFWERLREEKHKPLKVARCACARKLLHLAYGVVKSGQPFNLELAGGRSDRQTPGLVGAN